MNGNADTGASCLCLAPDGSRIRYFHGRPGGCAEAALAGLAPLEGTGGADHLVGFSLGTLPALEHALVAPDAVRRVTLVSPCAPLQAGDWLGRMDGALVFRLARDRPRLFAALTALQGRIPPGRVLDAMFAGASPSERALAASPGTRPILVDGLRGGFGRGYRDAVRAYLRDWRDLPGRVEARTHVIHGTADTWTPPGMGRWLAAETGARLTAIEGAGHYGTLVAARRWLGTSVPTRADRASPDGSPDRYR